ncbi:MAG: helix-turn-helix transcriptional regulator [Clostridiales bacterium]|nr:helix-turn-helix transcriptional regulator [Clostridiales bacterium]
MRYEPKLQIFAENLKKLREQNGLSPAQMARIMAISVRAYNMLERSELTKNIWLDAIFNLQDYFHIEAKDFFIPL